MKKYFQNKYHLLFYCARFFLLTIFCCFFTCSLYSTSIKLEFDNSDSLRKVKKALRLKDTVAWVSQDDKLILGSEISQLHVNLDITNIFTNATDSNIFRFRGLEDWKFNTSHDPSGISYYINSRFGKINFFSHKIPGTNLENKFRTSFLNFGYGYQYKRVIINLAYKKILGFTRQNFYSNEIDTLSNMKLEDMRLSFEFVSIGSAKFNKYGFSQLYIPVKASAYGNFKFESVLMRISDKGGVVPYVTGYDWNPAISNWTINYDNTGYMQQFNLYVQSLYLHLGGIIPLYKRKGERPKSLTFRIDLNEGFELFFHQVSPGNPVVEKSGLKFLAMTNFFGSLALVYSSTRVIFGTAIYYKANKFDSDSELSIYHYLRTITGYVAFRIPFKKGYEKIREKRVNLFNKKKN